MADNRDAVYVQLLHFGLARLRDAARAGHIAYCAIEAEHLHNIPSLIGESNELRHRHYFELERVHYLERVDHSIPDIGFTLRRYDELWQQLQELENPKMADNASKHLIGSDSVGHPDGVGPGTAGS